MNNMKVKDLPKCVAVTLLVIGTILFFRTSTRVTNVETDLNQAKVRFHKVNGPDGGIEDVSIRINSLSSTVDKQSSSLQHLEGKVGICVWVVCSSFSVLWCFVLFCVLLYYATTKSQCSIGTFLALCVCVCVCVCVCEHARMYVTPISHHFPAPLTSWIKMNIH
jgi:hypothetical protein